MNEEPKSEGGKAAPAQQAQQPQPSKPLNDNVPSPPLRSLSGRAGEKSETDRNWPPIPGENMGSDLNKAGHEAGAALDEARFTAGVVKLYEALLKEPIPEEMLRLVDKLGKRERE